MPLDMAIILFLVLGGVLLGFTPSTLPFQEWFSIFSILMGKWPWMAIFLTALIANAYLAKLFFRRVIELRQQGTKLRSILDEEKERFSMGAKRTLMLVSCSVVICWLLYSSFMGDFFVPNVFAASRNTQFVIGVTFAVISTLPLAGFSYLAFVRVSKYANFRPRAEELPPVGVLTNEIVLGAENEEEF